MVDRPADAQHPPFGSGGGRARPVRPERARHLDLEAMNAWIDGELTPAGRAAADAHLAACADCQRDLAELRATVRMLGALPEYAPRRSFTLGPEYAGKRPAVAPSDAASNLRFFPAAHAMRFAIAAAALLFLISVGGDLLTRNLTPTTVPAPMAAPALVQATSEAGLITAREQQPPPADSAAPEPAMQSRAVEPALKPAGEADTAEFAPAAAPAPTVTDGAAPAPAGQAGGGLAEPGTNPAPATFDGVDETSSAQPAPAGVSPWRIAELGFGLLLLWLLVSQVGLNWLRRHHS